MKLPIFTAYEHVYIFKKLGGGTFGHGGAIEKNGRGSTKDAARTRETDAR